MATRHVSVIPDFVRLLSSGVDWFNASHEGIFRRDQHGVSSQFVPNLLDDLKLYYTNSYNVLDDLSSQTQEHRCVPAPVEERVSRGN